MDAKRGLLAGAGVATVVALISLSVAGPGETAIEPRSAVVSDSALLIGLSPGAVFPFIDTTPNRIVRAHIAITDSTSDCKAGAAAPDNVQILVGQAGVALKPVMTAATNTGISTTPGQCVFHVTIRPGVAGVASKVTDIVVNNGGTKALTGVNTVTVTAKVR